MERPNEVTQDCIGGVFGSRWTMRSLALPLMLTGAVGLAQPMESCDPRDEDCRGLDVRVEGRDHTHDHDEDDDDDREDRGYRSMVDEVKRDEEQAREELARVERDGGGDEAIANGLVRVANRYRLAGEQTRKAYLRVVERVQEPMQRARLLRKLLAAAPITEDTGREVLRLTAQLDDEAAMARVLAYLHEIRERDLVRGPLANEYLEVASKLRSEEELGEALKNLLHPEELRVEIVQRALGMAEKLQSDEARVKVLREVTDHQQLTGDVVATYRRIAEGIRGESQRRLVASRLEDAQDDAGDERRHGRGYHVRMNPEEREKFERKMRKFEEKMRRLGEDLEKEFDRRDFDIDVDVD